MTVEYPDQWITKIRASHEILENLEKEYSEPVKVKASRNPDGTWDLWFQTVEYEEINKESN